MKILLLGKNGQVGWELQRALAPLGEVIALARTGNPDGLCGDLADAPGIASTVAMLMPDVIVNAAAYTAVDKAESESKLARAVNAAGPEVLARGAAQCNALLVHYSTDYVFDGSGNHPWSEDDATGPLSVYGRTKLEGEQAITKAGCRYLIFRTSWVYAAHGSNFVKTMLRLGRERDSLSIIRDQIGAPTGADLIADVTAHAIMRVQAGAPAGIYHLAATGETSWWAYARYVFDQAAAAGVELKVRPDAVTAVPSSAYEAAAQRPLNSRLNTAKLRTALGLSLPPWQQGVARMLTQILEK